MTDADAGELTDSGAPVAPSGRGRLTMLTPDQLTAAQRAVHDAITEGPRAAGPSDFALQHDDGSLVGPFNALVMAGDIGLAVQSVGAAIRYHGTLPADCRELAILLVARHRRAAFEWYAHSRVARRVGLVDSLVESTRLGHEPELASEEMAAAYMTTVELLRTGRLEQSTFDAAVATLGEHRVVELVILVGYYGMLADMLNGFEIGAPGDDPFVVSDDNQSQLS